MSSLESLKSRFLATHSGFFFGPGDTPITSKGSIDWDTFLIFIISEGTKLIENYTIYNMVARVPPEMKSLYMTRIEVVEKTLNVRPRLPKLMMPQGEGSSDERRQNSLDFYNKCEECVRECDKVVLDAIDKVLAVDSRQKLLCKVRSGIGMELTDEEIEAVLVHLSSSPERFATFRKDTLIALKVLNRFAKENEIRFEDAVTVFREYLD